VFYVLNSDNITLNNFKYTDSAAVLAMVQGERTKGVNILNTDITKAKQKLKAGFGVTDASVNWRVPQPGEIKKKKKNKKG
jgi:hypothetical protein